MVSKLRSKNKLGEMGRLVLLALPLTLMGFYLGLERVGLLPTPQTTQAASGLRCESWKSVKINGCSWEEYSQVPRPAKCITSSKKVTLNLDPPAGATRLMWAEVNPEIYCNETVSVAWQQAMIQGKTATIEMQPGSLGERKVCMYFISDSQNKTSGQCGAIIDYQPVLPTSLTCNSWESVNMNGCTLANWNKSPRPSACITNRTAIPVRLTSRGATHYRYAFVPASKNCSTVDLSGYPANRITSATVNLQASNCTKDNAAGCNGRMSGERKLCVQFFNNSAKSPVCGGMIEYRI